MSMLKIKQSRSTAPVFRQFISFVIVAVFVLQHLLIISPITAHAATPIELFFSEYIEGSSNNKALEIYNGTGTSVNLASGGYVVQMYFNGATTVGLTATLTGTVANGDVFVLAQSSANATILAQADQQNGSSWYNGDDAIVLRKGGAAGPIIDVIGQIGSDPGTEWGSGLTSTADNTLRRKSSIESGDTNPFDAFDPSIEWDGFATDTFGGLGGHSFTGGSGASTNPSGSGSANPNAVQPGENTTLTVTVNPGTNPASSGISVTANLAAIGGSATQIFSGNGNTFTYQATVAAGTTPGVKTLPFTISDSAGRSSTGSINLTVNSPVVVVNHIVISQVYGSGGNSGASYTNDYVELYNPTSSTVNLAGWSLQYASATGSGWDGSKQPLGGAIAPGEYYLVSLGTSNSTIGQPLPAANIAGELNLGSTAGKIALVSNGDSLSGNCPLSDSDIVDFVGYGTTANCSEGDVDAPAPSSTNAIFRNSNGSQDTNVNGSDFVAQSASPRRTAPIVEIGPSVLSTDPRNDFTNSPRDSSLTITFTEPIYVDPQWFTVNCAVTGAHNDATITSYNNGKNYVITPNVNFQAGEQCSVTINKDSVHDQDLDDSAPNTDTLTANYLWSFTIATGTAPPYTSDIHLTMGNPSDATANINEPNNYLMEKPEFALSYNRDRGTPNWVSWHLDDLWVGSLFRVDTFRPDPAVPSDWYRVQPSDYFGSGFDRGHMVPNADRDKETSSPINQATFLMTNIVPQAPDNNQGPWANMENDLRALLPANELYIIAGGAGTGGTGSNGGVTTTIAGGKVTVPAFTWKVALVIPKADGDDISRVSAATRTIAVIMPNSNTFNGSTIRDDDWRNFLVSIDQVEELTGYDFYENLPDAIENSVEAGINGNNPPGTANQVVNVAEDGSVSITLEAVGSGDLTYEILNQPTNGSLSGTGANRVYTPNLNFNGTDSFTFRVKQGQQNSNVSTVTINVTEVNDAPIANNDTATVAEDSGTNTIGVLGNDSSFPEINETLTVTAVTQGANGSVAITNGGINVSYTPNANFFGADSFTYTISDGNGGAATAIVNVNITAVNDAPSITGASISRQQNAVGSVSQIAAVSDIDDAASGLTVSVITAPAGIVVSNITNTGGAISATVAATCAAALGNNTVVLQVSDGNLIATANLTVNVTPSNAPVITLKPFITLSPPNHKYQTISLNQMLQSATDDCNGDVSGSVVIERVTSDEAENGDDDGDTLNDIVIGADCKTVQLRAERSGVGNGRVYTVTLRVGDSSGNVTRASYKVFVPRDNQTPIDDGAVYIVDSNCP